MDSQIYNKVSINKVADEFVNNDLPTSKIWGLIGEMGAGKTTLVKAVLTSLGYEGEVNSPTFSIIQEYPLPDGRKVYHMDWYRVGSQEELWEIGIDEYLDEPDTILFIEWPEIYLEELLDTTTLVPF